MCFEFLRHESFQRNGARCATHGVIAKTELDAQSVGLPDTKSQSEESMLGTVPKSNPTDNPGDQVLFFPQTL